MATPREQKADCGTATEGSDDALRGRILGAAFHLLMERGYAGTNTLEIATRAKVSKRELYAHFGSKRGILLHMIAMGAARMQRPLRLPEPRDRRQLDATLAKFGATLLREISSPAVMAIYRVALIEAERSPDVAQALDSAGREANRAALADLLRRAQAQGLLGAGEPMTMGGQFFSLLQGDLIVRLMLGLAKPPSPAEAAARARAATDALFALYPPERAARR
jgi:AcrR family transcriptional regulator